MGAVSAPALSRAVAAPGTLSVPEKSSQNTIISRVKCHDKSVTSSRYKWIARFSDEFR